MSRILLLLCLLIGAFAAPASAQTYSQRSYAPEDLRQLSYQERIRVVENEYFEQSNGRSIPDDQLEFYMDSIESGWNFSRIKQDIATSLGGNNNGSWRPNNSWSPRNVICSSIKDRQYQCRTPFNGRAELTQQISKTRCVEGKNWGQRPGMIWVDHGCRGRFTEVSGSGWGNEYNDDNYGNNRQRVTCASSGNKYRECRTNFQGNAQLYRQLSSNRCDFNRDWGTRSGYVWVRNGCRAEFSDSYNGGGNWNGNGNNWSGNNYSVTCTSDGSEYKTCAWDPRYGTPVLIERISKKACIAGRSWGYDNRGLWVNDGCRARFGTR